MENSFLHVRVDPIKKKEAEKILNSLGLNLTTGVNLCLNSIIRYKGLPFDIKLSRTELLGAKASEAENGFQKAVTDAVTQDRENGYPVALYDIERKCPYLEYADGRREYSER